MKKKEEKHYRKARKAESNIASLIESVGEDWLEKPDFSNKAEGALVELAAGLAERGLATKLVYLLNEALSEVPQQAT